MIKKWWKRSERVEKATSIRAKEAQEQLREVQDQLRAEIELARRHMEDGLKRQSGD